MTVATALVIREPPCFNRRWTQIKAIRTQIEAIWTQIGAIWTRIGAIWTQIGAIWTQIEAIGVPSTAGTWSFTAGLEPLVAFHSVTRPRSIETKPNHKAKTVERGVADLSIPEKATDGLRGLRSVLRSAPVSRLFKVARYRRERTTLERESSNPGIKRPTLHGIGVSRLSGMPSRRDLTTAAPGPVAATTGDDTGEVDLTWPRAAGQSP